MTRLAGFWLTLLIFFGGPVLEGNVRFGDFTIAAESSAAQFTFRGDARAPATIFEEGFTARGSSTDLLSHALDMRALSGPSSAATPSGNPAAASAPLLANFSYGRLVDNAARDLSSRFAAAAFRDGAITQTQATTIQQIVQTMPLAPATLHQGAAEMVMLKAATITSGEIGNAVAARIEGAKIDNNPTTQIDPQQQGNDVAVHRIGGTSNMALSDRDKVGQNWGLSVLLGGTPQSAADQMRNAFPKATGLVQASQITASSAVGAITDAGFTVTLNPSKALPNHAVIQHPGGVSGYEANLAKLIAVFKDTPTPPPPPPPDQKLPR